MSIDKKDPSVTGIESSEESLETETFKFCKFLIISPDVDGLGEQLFCKFECDLLSTLVEKTGAELEGQGEGCG